MKIIVGGIVQEGNSFSPSVSTLDSFREHFFLQGEELLVPQSINNELKGFQEAIAERGATAVPTLFTTAISSGKITREALNQLKSLLLARLDEAGTVDGVLFALHGALVAEDEDDPDGEIVVAIRAKIGPDIPFVITLDSHANVTRRIIDGVDGLVGYRTFPHIDFSETGHRAGRLLFSMLDQGESTRNSDQCNSDQHTSDRRNARPYKVLRKVPMILPAENQQTFRGPMAELWREAGEGERQGVSLATSLFAVQPWLDVDEMGFSVVVQGKDAARCEEEAERLARIAWGKRRDFDVALYSVKQVLDVVERRSSTLPVVASDSADSPGAGSPGDSNAVLRELLKYETDRKYRCLLTMVDRRAVEQALTAGVGHRVRLSVGHSVSRNTGEPLEIEGNIVHIGEGQFLFGSGFSENLIGHLGRCAVVQIGEISLLLHERAVFTGDPAMYRSVGLEPTEADFVLVKSANQFRAEYERLTEHIFILDTPGASTANLRSLPFRKVPRPIYPLDKVEDSLFR